MDSLREHLRRLGGVICKGKGVKNQETRWKKYLHLHQDKVTEKRGGGGPSVGGEATQK